MLNDDKQLTNACRNLTNGGPSLTNDTEIIVEFLSGDQVVVTKSEISRLARHRYVITYLFFFSFLTVLLDIFGDSQYLSTWVALLVYQTQGLISVLVMVIALRLLIWFRGADRPAWVHFSPVLLLASAINVSVSYWLKIQLAPDLPFHWSWFIAFIMAAYVFFEVATILMAVYALPHALKEIRAHSSFEGLGVNPPVSKDITDLVSEVEVGTVVRPPHVIEVSGKRISVQSILHIKAQGNYVDILADTETFFLAIAFSSVINQLPKGLGLQVHRSHWVARSAVVEMTTKDGGQWLILTNNFCVPVAQRKLSAVRQWLS